MSRRRGRPSRKPQTRTSPGNTRSTAEISFRMINPNKVRPMEQGQPRLYFDEAAMQDLMGSIKLIGQQQAIRVFELKSPDEDGNRYELIWGERRTEACRRLNIQVRAEVIPEPDEVTALAMATVENCCREDISPYEKAIAFSRLKEARDCSVAELAEAVGMHRTSVHRYLRLANLPKSVFEMLNPERPENDQLQVGVALELETYMPAQRAEVITVAPQLAGLHKIRADAIIQRHFDPEKKRAKTRQRIPSDLSSMLSGFMYNITLNADRYLDMPRKQFNNLVASLPAEFVREIMNKIQRNIMRLHKLHDELARARGIKIEEETFGGRKKHKQTEIGRAHV